MRMRLPIMLRKEQQAEHSLHGMKRREALLIDFIRAVHELKRRRKPIDMCNVYLQGVDYQDQYYLAKEYRGLISISLGNNEILRYPSLSYIEVIQRGIAERQKHLTSK